MYIDTLVYILWNCKWFHISLSRSLRIHIVIKRVVITYSVRNTDILHMQISYRYAPTDYTYCIYEHTSILLKAFCFPGPSRWFPWSTTTRRSRVVKFLNWQRTLNTLLFEFKCILRSLRLCRMPPIFVFGWQNKLKNSFFSRCLLVYFW